ncbi:MAG: nitrilase-related carbon-nitrogen hydrolase [Thalassobaculum sp.]
MTDQLIITLAQLNPRVGDIAGNFAKLRAVRGQAAAAGADVILTPELYACGYPPEDLVLKPMFVAEVRDAVEALALETADGGPADPARRPMGRGRQALQRACCCSTAARSRPRATRSTCRTTACSTRSGCSMSARCRARWTCAGCASASRSARTSGAPDVVECVSETGGEMLLVPNGSPFDSQKLDNRLQHATSRVVESGLPLVYLNQVGGQDELVFDGASFVLNADRTVAAQLPAWEEAVVHTTWSRGPEGWSCGEDRDGGAQDRVGGRPTARWCWDCATTSPRTAFPASSSACPAASTARSPPPWRSMRSARTRCAA